MKKAVILPLYKAPHFAEQVTDWLWQAFGEGLSREFFHSIVEHSQTGALPLTFIALEGEQLLGTVGLWRCDLITRQDLFPWLAALYVDEAARGKGLAGQLQQHVIAYAAQSGMRSSISGLPAATSTNVTAGSTSVMVWNTPTRGFTSTVIRSALPQVTQRSDGEPASG